MYLTKQELAKLLEIQNLRQQMRIESNIMDNFFDNFILSDNSEVMRQKCQQTKEAMRSFIAWYYTDKSKKSLSSYQTPSMAETKKEWEKDNQVICAYFGELMTQRELKVAWYDENFNSLFFYGATHHMQGSLRWNSPSLSYLFDSNMRRDMMNFWQENIQPNSMLALANLLDNMPVKSEVFFRAWLKIASTKKNKKELANTPVFDFVKNYNEYDLGKSYIYKIEALALFEKPQCIELIQTEFEKQKGNLIIQGKIARILEKLGVEQSVDNIDVLLQSTQEEHIVDYKYLSKEAIMKNGKLSEFQMNRFFELMQYFINSEQNKHGAKAEYENTSFFIIEKNYEVRAFKITLTNRYRFNQPDSLKELEETLRIYTNDYLKEVFPSLNSADFSSYQVKEELYSDFKTFSQMIQLREKLNEKKAENILAPKRKI